MLIDSQACWNFAFSIWVTTWGLNNHRHDDEESRFVFPLRIAAIMITLLVLAGCGVRESAPRWILDVSDSWGLMVTGNQSNYRATSISSLKGSTAVSTRRGWIQEIIWTGNECADELCLEVGWWAYGSDREEWQDRLSQLSLNAYREMLSDSLQISATHINSVASIDQPALVRIVFVPKGYGLDVRVRSDQLDPSLLFVFHMDAVAEGSTLDKELYKAGLTQALAVAAHEFFHLYFARAYGPRQALSAGYIESNEAGAVCSGLTLEAMLSRRFELPLTLQAQTASSYRFMKENLGMVGPEAASVMVRTRVHWRLLEAIRSQAPLAMTGRYSAIIDPDEELGRAAIYEECHALLDEIKSTSSDALRRNDIMRLAESRATQGVVVTRRTYFGDGVWHQRAANELGYDFVAVGGGVNHHLAFQDLQDRKAILLRLGVQ